MNLEISCGDLHVNVGISGAPEKPMVSIGGRELDCDWVRISDGHYCLITDGRVFDLAVEVAGSLFSVSGREGQYKLEVHDTRALRKRESLEEGATGLQRVHADMPGKIIRVLVNAGDAVAHDQALLVVEAMKMQNEIRAPKAGTIKEITVVEGKTVNSGEFLLSVE